jgi:hypothetical protein
MTHDLVPFSDEASISLTSIHGIHSDADSGTVTIEYGQGCSLTFAGTHKDAMDRIDEWSRSQSQRAW